MDYLKQSASFKVRKVLRYVLLYGASRTYRKVLGQLHVRRRYQTLPKNFTRASGKEFIGLIGCGNFAFTTIAYYLRKKFGRSIAACMDIDINRAASMSAYYKIPVYTECADDIINNDNIRMLYIASFHSSHAEYAIKGLEKNKHVYIEKPHVVSRDQLVRLASAMAKSEGKVFLGFNRPASPFGQAIQRYLGGETGPGIYNWFIAGHDLEPGHWYHRAEEGGRVLGNLCHWTDFTLKLVPPDEAFPIKITPSKAVSSDTDVAVAYTFADNTVAVITFSAKGHAFEGVKERFSAYKGDCMITMDDFKTMEVNVIDKKLRFVNFYRNHGHANSIGEAAENVSKGLNYDRDAAIAHVWNSGLLFLETKRALEGNSIIIVNPFDKSMLIGSDKKYEASPAI